LLFGYFVIQSIFMSQQKYHFPGQHKDEEIIFLLRRHPIVLLGKILVISFFLFILIVFWIKGAEYLPVFFEEPYLNFSIFVSLLSLLFIWLYAFIVWVDYYLDLWILTNERLLDIEQKGLFYRVISELRLNRIQDITSEVRGFVPTFFHFGDISIQTAAEQGRFKLNQIPHPVEVRRTIIKFHKGYLEREKREDNQSL